MELDCAPHFGFFGHSVGFESEVCKNILRQGKRTSDLREADVMMLKRTCAGKLFPQQTLTPSL